MIKFKSIFLTLVLTVSFFACEQEQTEFKALPAPDMSSPVENQVVQISQNSSQSVVHILLDLVTEVYFTVDYSRIQLVE